MRSGDLRPDRVDESVHSGLVSSARVTFCRFVLYCIMLCCIGNGPQGTVHIEQASVTELCCQSVLFSSLIWSLTEVALQEHSVPGLQTQLCPSASTSV